MKTEKLIKSITRDKGPVGVAGIVLHCRTKFVSEALEIATALNLSTNRTISSTIFSPSNLKSRFKPQQ